MDRGAWWATVHGVTKSQAQLKQLSTQTCWYHAQSSCSPEESQVDLLKARIFEKIMST